MKLNELPIVHRTRRNHGLEHATIHMLSTRVRGLRMAGRSTPFGFYLYADLKPEDIDWAVHEAIRRMQAGEKHLAVHPGCGTNMVTAGMLAGGLAFLATTLTSRKSSKWYDTLPNATFGGLLGALAAQPLGPWLQANVTTSADMRGVRVRSITRRPGPVATHFVEVGD
jgi:hypothetical protein